MYAKIQKTLFPENPRRRPRAETGGFINAGDNRERILRGGLDSARTTFSPKHLVGLLEYSPERLDGHMGGLGSYRIAENKATDAIKGFRRRAFVALTIGIELRIVSGDA